MPTATSPPRFELRNADWSLLALRLYSSDLQQLRQDWEQRFGRSSEFFDADALVLDFSSLQADAELDLPALLALLHAARLRPLAWRGGSTALAAQASAAALVRADELRLSGEGAVALASAAEAAPHTSQNRGNTPEPAANPAPGALLIDKPLRSGQQVYARGRDLVVTAIVNPGAEVVADGHIHVYAPLRGKAIAGARGDAQARIFSTCLQAELLAIAGTYRTSEQALPPQVLGKAAQVWLERSPGSERLHLEPIPV